MCDATTLLISALAVQGVSGLLGAKSQYDSSKYNAKVAEANANQQEILANDTINQGNANAARVRSEAARNKATQLSALASNGVDLSSGSALSLLGDTAGLGELDAQTTLNNSLREAYGLRQQAANSRSEAKMLKRTGKQQAFSTLLTTAASMYGAYQMANLGGSKLTQPGADAYLPGML